MKQKVGKQLVLSKQPLIEKAQAALQRLAHMPQAVRAIFGQPDFRYAAEPK